MVAVRAARLYLVVAVTAAALACSPRVADIDRYAEAAKKGDKSSLRKLVALLDHPDDDVKVRAYGGIIAAPADTRAYVSEKLIALLRSSESESTKEFSAGLLGKLKSPEAVPALVDSARNRSFKRRYVAFSALGEIQDVSAVDTLIDGLSDPVEDVRKYASRALIKTGPRALPRMMERYASTTDEAVRGYLIRAFGELRVKEPEQLLLAALGGPNRHDAIWALGKGGTGKALGPLVALLGDSDYQTRLRAAQALGDLNQPAAIGPLRSALNDKETLVREWAARSLELLTGERTKYRDEKGRLALPYSIYH